MFRRKLAAGVCAVALCGSAAAAQDDHGSAPAAQFEQVKLPGVGLGGGSAVAVDGDTAVAGAPDIGLNGIQPGTVTVFVRSGGVWQQQQVLQRNGLVGLGGSVDVSGETLIAGWKPVNGTPHEGGIVYTRSGTTWSFQAALGTESAAHVAIDGDTALVSTTDAVEVFVRTGSTWALQTRLSAPDRPGTDPSWKFGEAVDIAGDTAIVGAPWATVGANAKQGAVYVFTRSGTTWSPQAKLTRGAGGANANVGGASR